MMTTYSYPSAWANRRKRRMDSPTPRLVSLRIQRKFFVPAKGLGAVRGTVVHDQHVHAEGSELQKGSSSRASEFISLVVDEDAKQGSRMGHSCAPSTRPVRRRFCTTWLISASVISGNRGRLRHWSAQPSAWGKSPFAWPRYRHTPVADGEGGDSAGRSRCPFP